MHPDLPQEQAYFDRARRCATGSTPCSSGRRACRPIPRRCSSCAAGSAGSAWSIPTRRWHSGGSRPGAALVHRQGRIWDDDNDLVVNRQAPIAAPFYTAVAAIPRASMRSVPLPGEPDPGDRGDLFRDLAEAIAAGREPGPVLSDALLESLGRDRSGELAEIVATIQAAQYDVISRDVDQLLVVQGGPGTGKTVVGLHRVSWLLFNLRDRLEPNDVLIVGSNPAFVRYISAVLPALGDEAVVQLPLSALGPRVRIGSVDPPAVRRLKGDRRMLRLLERGLRNRQRHHRRCRAARAGGRQVSLNGRRIATRPASSSGAPTTRPTVSCGHS